MISSVCVVAVLVAFSRIWEIFVIACFFFKF